ncbi:FHA domain-containing protein [Microcoleus sp. FACHB-SPT15]|nr:FHA domain-containing protein [Microcoleus sp. FACHB-SPT15]
MVITVSLRQPHQSTPLQKWTFENEPIIRIGRAVDNHVVLHSSVVSRHHVEIRHIASYWQVINFGNNGTYLNGELITTIPVVDGMIVALATSGPQLQINLGDTAQKPRQKTVSSQHPASQENQAKERDTYLQKPKFSSESFL